MVFSCPTTCTWDALYQVAEVRKLRAYAQMDKQKNMKELEAKLKKEHSLEITSLRLLLGLGGDSPIQRGGAPGQVRQLHPQYMVM